MTTDVIGQLPCPECNTTTDLKSDGRKHTLKCPECGVLAYYQSQNAKQHIEQRLEEQEESALQKPKPENVITLQLPDNSEAQQRYILTLEQLAIEPVNGEMTTVNTNELPANDGADSELSDKEDDPQQQGRGFFDRIGQYL